MSALTPERMLEIVRGLKDPADLADRLAPSGVGELADLAAITLSFDRRIAEELLRPRVGPAPGTSVAAPGFEALAAHPDIEPLGTPQGWFRVRSSSRPRRIARAARRLGDRGLDLLHAALADAFHALGRDFEALELYHRVRPGAPAPALAFRERFDEAEARFELSRCADLIRAVEQALADEARPWPRATAGSANPGQVHPLLALRRARARLSARTQTAEDWYGTIHYFARESLHGPLERLLAEAAGGDVAAPWLLHLHAPGGSGKTKLLRWLASRRCAGQGVPVARLDFDSVVRAPDVWEILVEVAEQLDPQLPDRPLATFLDEVRGAVASLGVGSIVGAADAEVDADERERRERRRAENLPTRVRLDSDVPKRLASLLGGAPTAAEAPIVVIIDTLEEAQLRHVTDLPRLVEALAVVHRACPGLRVVLAGRYDLRSGGARGAARLDAPTRPRGPGAAGAGADGASLAERLRTEGQTLEVRPLEGDEAVGFLAARGLPASDPRIPAVVAKGKGNPLKLALLAEIVAQAPEITEAQIAERADVDLVYLTERVLARVEPELRWIIRYGVVPDLLTKAFIADVMLPVLAEVLAADEAALGGRSEALDDPERDLADALRSLYRPGLFAARVDPASWSGEVDRLWNRLRDFAGSTSWISTVLGDDDALRFHEVVLEPMRRLVAQRPVHALLSRRAAEWLSRRGVDRPSASSPAAPADELRTAGPVAGSEEKEASPEARSGPREPSSGGAWDREAAPAPAEAASERAVASKPSRVKIRWHQPPADAPPGQELAFAVGVLGSIRGGAVGDLPSDGELARGAEAIGLKLRAKDIAGAATLWEALRQRCEPSPAALLRVAEIALHRSSRLLPREIQSRARVDRVEAFVRLAERGELPSDRRKEFIGAVEALDGKRPGKPSTMPVEKLRRWALVERFRWNEARAGQLLEELAARAPGTTQAVDALVALAELSTTRCQRRGDALREALRVASDRPRDASGALDRRSRDAIACQAAKALAWLGDAEQSATLVRRHAPTPPAFEFVGRACVLLARLGLDGASDAMLRALGAEGSLGGGAAAEGSAARPVIELDSREIADAVRSPAALVALADALRRTGLLEQAWRIGQIGATSEQGVGATETSEAQREVGTRRQLSLRLAGAQALSSGFDGGAIGELEAILVDAKRLGFTELAAAAELAAARFHLRVSGNLRRAEEHQLAAEALPIDETSRVTRALSRIRLERRLGRWLRNAPDRQDPAALERSDLPADSQVRVAIESLRRATTQSERSRRAKQLLRSLSRIDAPWARAKAAEDLGELEPLSFSAARARRLGELLPGAADAAFVDPAPLDHAWYELRAAQAERTLGDPRAAAQRLEESWRRRLDEPLLVLAQLELAARLGLALDGVEGVAARSSAAAKRAGRRLSLPLRLQLLLGVVEHEIAAKRLAEIPHRTMSELSELTTQRDAPGLARRRHLVAEAQWHLATARRAEGGSANAGASEELAERMLLAARGAASEDGDERAIAELTASIDAIRAAPGEGADAAPPSAPGPEPAAPPAPEGPEGSAPILPPIDGAAARAARDAFLLPFSPTPAATYAIDHAAAGIRASVFVQSDPLAPAAPRRARGGSLRLGDATAHDDAALAERGGALLGESPQAFRASLLEPFVAGDGAGDSSTPRVEVVRLEPATPGLGALPWEWALRSTEAGALSEPLVYRAASPLATQRQLEAYVARALRTWHARRSPAQRKRLVGASAVLQAWKTSARMPAALATADPATLRAAVEQADARSRPGSGTPPRVMVLAQDDGHLAELWPARGWRVEWLRSASGAPARAALVEFRPDVVVVRGWVRRGLLGGPLSFRIANERPENFVPRASRAAGAEILDAKGLAALLCANPAGERPLVVLESLNEPSPRGAAEQVVLRNAFAGELFLLGGVPAVLATGGLGVPSVQMLLAYTLARHASLLEALSELWRLDARVEGLDLGPSWAAANSVLFAHDPLWRPTLGRAPAGR